MSGERRLKSCVRCGGEFMGGADARFCPDCRAIRGREGVRDKLQAEPEEEKTGWRHMYRDRTGTVIVPGGNVINALDELCAYEEACEALGVKGPAQLRNLLTHVATLMPKDVIHRCAKESRRPEPRKRGASSLVRVEYGCRCCGSCGHYIPESGTQRGTAGHCDAHPRMVRSGGGKKGRLVEVPGELRKVAGAREACKQWTARKTAPNAGRDATSSGPSGHLPLKGNALDERAGRAPEWVGPSAELLPKEP